MAEGVPAPNSITCLWRNKAQYRPALFHNFGQILEHKKMAFKLTNYQFPASYSPVPW